MRDLGFRRPHCERLDHIRRLRERRRMPLLPVPSVRIQTPPSPIATTVTFKVKSRKSKGRCGCRWWDCYWAGAGSTRCWRRPSCREGWTIVMNAGEGVGEGETGLSEDRGGGSCCSEDGDELGKTSQTTHGDTPVFMRDATNRPMRICAILTGSEGSL